MGKNTEKSILDIDVFELIKKNKELEADKIALIKENHILNQTKLEFKAEIDKLEKIIHNLERKSTNINSWR